jgi:hypothetical protein
VYLQVRTFLAVSKRRAAGARGASSQFPDEDASSCATVLVGEARRPVSRFTQCGLAERFRSDRAGNRSIDEMSPSHLCVD